MQTQTIYCGDNAEVLRKSRADLAGQVDLIYIDPPLGTARDGLGITARRRQSAGFDAKRYVELMKPLIIQLRQVLKDTGSLYYHCDWRSDAHVRIMLDEVFGERNFRSHIIWRSAASASKIPSFESFPIVHESIFLYSRTDEYLFNRQYIRRTDEALANQYRQIEEETGRRYRLVDLTSPRKDRPNQTYEFMGITRTWRYSREKMQQAQKQGLIVQARPDAVPALKQYLDEQAGTTIDNLWMDIQPVSHDERLGYAGQKPVALLTRIIEASSSPGDVVLDAFCGSGTTLYAAQELGRLWIGIDINPSACRIAAQRLESHFHLVSGRDYFIRGVEADVGQVRSYSGLEFENWAVLALNQLLTNNTPFAQRLEPSLGDKTRIQVYPASASAETPVDLFVALQQKSIPVQTKQKDKVTKADVAGFASAMRHHQWRIAIYLAFGFAEQAIHELQRVRITDRLEIVPLTVSELVSELRSSQQ